MNRSLIPAQHKLAEKLTILNHRGVGMLTRIYNIKKVYIYIYISPQTIAVTVRQNIVSFLRNTPIQRRRSHSGKTRRHYSRELRIRYNNF